MCDIEGLLTKGSRDTNDQSFACDGFTQINLVARRVLNENVQIRERVTNFDEGACRGMELEDSGGAGSFEGSSSENSCGDHSG
jgi:hypothetical protein